MTAAGSTAPSRGPLRSPRLLLHELFERQRTLASLGITLAFVAVPTGILQFIDARTFADANVWTKPLKFMISLGLFALTMAWIIGYVDADHRKRWPIRLIAAVVTIASLFEVAYITFQAWLAEASHFNVGDSLHAAMYTLMGVGAVSLTATTLALAVIVARRGDRRLAPAFKLSLVLGLALTFVLGTASGGYMSAQPGHFAAGLKAAAGLPILGWSTVGGDWRVAHFFGMHSQQVIPAFGALAATLAPHKSIVAVIVFAAGYTLLTTATFIQAMLNLPFIAF